MTKTEEQHIIDLFYAYANGNLTETESAELKSWLEGSEENRRYFLRLREIWVAVTSKYASEEFDAARAYRRFRRRVFSSSQSKRGRHIGTVAACAAALVAILAALLPVMSVKPEPVAEAAAPEVVVDAPLGSSCHIVLPDSTQVWLNAGTVLKYSSDFGTAGRDVELSGEAFFEVSHDEGKPFTVSSRDMTAVVTGTRFNYSNYEDDASASVTLLEGSVTVSGSKTDARQVLLPDQRVVIDGQDGSMTLEDAAESKDHVWKDGGLCFDDELLPDIVKKLHRRYGVDITIKNDELMGRRFYADFGSGNPGINEIIDMLVSTGGIRCSREDGSIVLQ